VIYGKKVVEMCLDFLDFGTNGILMDILLEKSKPSIQVRHVRRSLADLIPNPFHPFQFYKFLGVYPALDNLKNLKLKKMYIEEFKTKAQPSFPAPLLEFWLGH
jgi:hypothetical protein